MAAAIGQSNPNPLPVHGPMWFDARDYGVSPSNPDNGPALQAAIDAAGAWVTAQNAFGGVGQQATVFVPGATSPYVIKTPVFIDWSFIRLLGEGPNTWLQGATASSQTLIYTGISRSGRSGANSPGTSYRPDLYSILDTYAAPAAGQRWGLQTNGDAYLYTQAGPLTHGTTSPVDGIPGGWFTCQQLTFDFALAGPSGGEMPACQNIWGIGNAGACYPFNLSTTAPNSFVFYWTSQAGKFGATTAHSVAFSTGSAAGLQRITIQVDLVAGAIQVYAGTGGATASTQLAVTGTPPAAGTTFAENLYLPFVVNGTTGGGGTGGQSAGNNFAFYGLCVAEGLRYADNGAGAAQVAHPQMYGAITNGGGNIVLLQPGSPTGGTFTVTIDGATSAPIPGNPTAAQLQAALQAMSLSGTTLTVAGPAGDNNVRQFNITASGGSLTFVPAAGSCNGSALTGEYIDDHYRYFPAWQGYPFSTDPYVIAFFPFEESPLVAEPPRHLTLMSGSQSPCSALLLNNNAVSDVAYGLTFEDFSISLVDGVYGMPFVQGDVLGSAYEGVSFAGGLHGYAQHLVGANYTISFDDCGFTGSVAPFFGFWSTARLEGCSLADVARCGYLLVGCNFTLLDAWVSGDSGSPYAVVYAASDEYGGTYTINRLTCDFEAGNAFLQGLFYFEPAAYADTTVRATDVYGGLIGNTPVFRLKSLSGPTVYAAAYLFADNVGGDTPHSVVDSDGSLWTGEVRNSYGDDCAYVTGSLANGRPALRVLDQQSRTFPRFGQGTWLRGTVEVAPVITADGQYERFRVGLDGTFGTATPPTWQGFDSLPSTPSALAAYAIDHAAIAATLSGQASAQGFLSDTAAVALANALFRGESLGAPTTWYAALLTTPVTRNGLWTAEVPTSGTGYARAAVANTSASFAASSAGSKASAAAIAWPTATGPYTVQGVAFYATETGGTPWMLVGLAEPISFAAGQTPTIAAGGLTFAHVPYGGQFSGGLTDYGWGNCYDALFGGAALGAPATWYPALSTAATSRATTAPAEPAGDGYARPALAVGSTWLVGSGPTGLGNDKYNVAGEARWGAAASFGAPTGSWGTVVAGTIQDASTAGNAWFQFPLVNPAAPGAGSPAPSFAAGALVLATA